MKDYYSILQIKPEATKEEIRVAYRTLAKKYHPDVNGGASWAEERFKELHEAYSVLSDYFKKAEYDRKYAAFYKRKTGSVRKPSSAVNRVRPQAASPNRPAQPKPSTPPKQTSGSNPQDAAQTKKNFEGYVKDKPRKAKAFSHWMNFDHSSKNSIFDGIKSGKKLRFEFANKVVTWFRTLILFGQLVSLTALIFIFLMNGQEQLEQVFGTKLTFNSHASNVEYAYWIDDSGVTHSRKCPNYEAGKGHGSDTETSKRCDCSYCWPKTGNRQNERAVTRNTSSTTSSASQKSAKPLVSSTSSATNRSSATSSSPVSSSFSSYPTSNEWAKRSDAPSDLRAFEKKIAEPKWQNAESVTPRHPLDDDFPPRRGGRGIATTGEPHPRTDAERITDSDWETSEGSEQEDFWITEEDDTTHNTTCDRYGEGEGMYSAVGSGTDCDECGGAR